MAVNLATLIAVVGLPFLAAALTPFVYRLLGERTAYYAAAVALACLGLVASLFGTHGAASVQWIPELGVSLRFYVDGLSLLIATLASGVGVLILTYSGAYMHDEPGQAKYYAALLAFMGSMLGVAFAADMVVLFLFWELTSLSSYVLIGHYQRAGPSLYASRKSMLITVAGGLFMLAGFLVLHAVSADALGSATWALFGDGGILAGENAAAMQTALAEQGLLVPVLALVGIGAAAKSAQVPLHIWLPNAMEAPTPVSAFLHSATMVKAGVYLVGRLRPLLGGEEWTAAFVALGLLTMTVTAILAVAATDIKELLAYSTASHLGLIVAGFGFTSFYGAETGAFHIVNHALFKAALFLVAGIVAHEAGTRALNELGGLREDLPITAAIAVIAGLGMAGVPPFNGFYSKEFLFKAAWEYGTVHGGVAFLVPVVAVFGSIFTFLYSIRFVSMFFGEKPDSLGHVHSPPALMVGPPALLAALAAVVGIGGVTATFGVHLEPLEAFVASVIEATGGALGGGSHAVAASGAAGAVAKGSEFTYHLPTSGESLPAATMSAITIVVGAVAYTEYDRLHDRLDALVSGPLTANYYYDALTEGANPFSDRVRNTAQTRLLRTYATWTLAAFVVLTLGAYAAAEVAVTLPLGELFPVRPPKLAVWLVLALAGVGAAMVVRANSHVSGVLTLSILGFMVAIFYILSKAPDLALTQLVVETLVLVIFLLVLDRLPAFYGKVKRSTAIQDSVLSVAVGATVATTVLLATAGSPDSIAQYFVEVAYPEGGGSNIVNIILVDFRAFDTMGEIAVVSMAALSIITLVALRERGETQ
ncbi:hydrogen gas-evolving membrane-bound hydrogenase subunit E [Halorubellus sp. PRR65]|uniref:hydrogen gas-evolving membrane-bound hydrogenase subunit E n=1 Tax=Halorubellus sp. PRR65 TaxID=3098148 RepID=UPI002B2628F4|nr:hydrogen gas-evolving membrane-bound hydrogenase subunit E [Halorubellus sp. PRR65]